MKLAKVLGCILLATAGGCLWPMGSSDDV